MKTALFRIDQVSTRQQVPRAQPGPSISAGRFCIRAALVAGALGLLLAGTLDARAQQQFGPRDTRKQQQPGAQRYDVGVTYAGEDSVREGTDQRFWAQGGSVELGANVWRQVGLVASFTGGHAHSIGRSGVPLSLVTATVGARYRWQISKRTSAYAEGMVGLAAGFNSRFPSVESTQTSANSAAFQIGGGVDYRIRKWLSIRVVDADWIRTGLPNAAGNSQNIIRVGAGVVARF